MKCPDFLFDLFLEAARAEIVGFLGDLKTTKGHFKINWPLATISIFCKEKLIGLNFLAMNKSDANKQGFSFPFKSI